MNTRLQVEHPVTEMVTGIDLVEEMIRVAAGETLRLKQSDVKLAGWAVESRIYAEDPTRNFLPSTGRLVTYRPPPEGEHGGAAVRNDTGVTEGGEISIYYDPMIAKLVTHAPTREAAIEAQSRALDAFAIEGIRHNIPFLSALMAASALARGAALDRLHRGGISRRVQARAAAGRGRAALSRGRRRDRPSAQRAQAPHLGPDARSALRALRARARRALGLGPARVRARRGGRQYPPALRRRRARARSGREQLAAGRTGLDRHRGRRRQRADRGAGAPDPERGVAVARRRLRRGAGLHAARGRARGADAGEDRRAAPASSSFARCRASSRRSSSRPARR